MDAERMHILATAIADKLVKADKIFPGQHEVVRRFAERVIVDFGDPTYTKMLDAVRLAHKALLSTEVNKANDAYIHLDAVLEHTPQIAEPPRLSCPECKSTLVRVTCYDGGFPQTFYACHECQHCWRRCSPDDPVIQFVRELGKVR